MTHIKKLKNSQGVQVYPQTHTKAVIDDGGTVLDSILQNKANKNETYTKEEIGNIITPINEEILVGELPSTGVSNKIYRVPGDNSYSDYGWNGTEFVKLATFDGSPNNVVKTIRQNFTFNEKLQARNNIGIYSDASINNVLNVVENGFFIVDHTNNICLKYTDDGFDVDSLSTHFKNKIIDLVGSNKETDIITLAKADDKIGVLKADSDITIGVISDIHGDSSNLSHFLEFCNYYDIPYMIHLGDTVNNKYSDGNAFWVSVEGSEYIMNTPGNHDTRLSGTNWWNYASTQGIYDMIISQFINNIKGLVQPQNAASENKCYYYVDVVNEETVTPIRLVVFDSMTHYNEEKGIEQYNWLESILEDSISNNKHVLICTHIPVNTNDGIKCSFNYPIGTIIDGTLAGNKAYLDKYIPGYELTELIQTYINRGLIFIGWFCGHTHKDFIGHVINKPQQLQVSVTTSRRDYGKFSTNYDKEGTIFADCFSIIGIDTTNKLLNLIRIGRNRDKFGYIRDNFCYDYKNNKLIVCN